MPNAENVSPINADDYSKEDAGQPAAASAGEAGAATDGGLAGIAETLAEQLPEVQEHAIKNNATDNGLFGTQNAGPVDVDGNPFDAAIHKVGPDGNPTLSANGKLIKKPGRKAGGGSRPSGASSQIGDGSRNSVLSRTVQGPSQTEIAAIQARAAGIAAANMLMQFGVIFGGEEWQPRINKEIGLDEKTMLENSFADYFTVKGISDIPPGMALAMAVGAYSLPRFTMPKTQARASSARKKIATWWANRKLRKHGLKAVDAEDKK